VKSKENELLQNKLVQEAKTSLEMETLLKNNGKSQLEKYQILEHVIVNEVNWCFIKYDENEKMEWVNNVPKEDLPQTLQEAMEEEFNKEIQLKQDDFQINLTKSLEEKDEELRKYKARTHIVLKKN